MLRAELQTLASQWSSHPVYCRHEGNKATGEVRSVRTYVTLSYRICGMTAPKLHFGYGGDKYCYVGRFIEECHNGLLPAGHVVHHKDLNPWNNLLGNLDAMTKAAHILLHRQLAKSGAIKPLTVQAIKLLHREEKAAPSDIARAFRLRGTSVEKICLGQSHKRVLSPSLAIIKAVLRRVFAAEINRLYEIMGLRDAGGVVGRYTK